MGMRRRWRLKGRHGLLVLLLFLLAWFIAWLFGRPPGATRGGGSESATTAASGGGGPEERGAATVVRGQPAGAPTGGPSGDLAAAPTRSLRGPAHVTGRVLDKEGRPLAFAEVLVMRALDGTSFPGLAPDPVLARARADENGRFFATVVPPEDGIVLLLPGASDQPWTKSPRLRPPPWGAPVQADLRRGSQHSAPLLLNARWAPGWETPPETIRLLARPAPGSTPLGPAPWCLDARGRPPRTPEAFPHLALVPGKPTPLTFLGDGAWDLLVWAPGARARALRVDGSSERIPPLELHPLASSPSDMEGSDAWWYLPQLRDHAATLWPAGALDLDEEERRQVVVLEAGREPHGLAAPPTPWAEYRVEGDAEAWELRLVPADLPVIDANRFGFVATALLGEWPTKGRVRAGSFRVEWVDDLTGRTVSGGAADAAQEKPLVLHPPAREVVTRKIEGRVVDAIDGRPLKGARVLAGRALPTPPRVHLVPQARSDANGRFEIRGVPAGSLDLWISAPRHVSSRTTVTLDASPSATATTTIALPPGPACTVTLPETGAPGLRAILVDRQGSTVEAPFDTEGRAFLPHVAPGPHVLLLAIGPFQAATEDWLRLGRIPGARALRIPDDRDITVAWRPGPWSTGRVRVALLGDAPDSVVLDVFPDGAEALAGVSARLHREGVADGDEIALVRWPPGRYLGVAHSGLASSLVAFTLKPGAPPAVTLEFRFE